MSAPELLQPLIEKCKWKFLSRSRNRTPAQMVAEMGQWKKAENINIFERDMKVRTTISQREGKVLDKMILGSDTELSIRWDDNSNEENVQVTGKGKIILDYFVPAEQLTYILNDNNELTRKADDHSIGFACVSENNVFYSGAVDADAYTNVIKAVYEKATDKKNFKVNVPCDADICQNIASTFTTDSEEKFREIMTIMHQMPDMEYQSVPTSCEISNISTQSTTKQYINLTPIQNDAQQEMRTLPETLAKDGHILATITGLKTGPANAVTRFQDANFMDQCIRHANRTKSAVGQASTQYSCVMYPFDDIVHKNAGALAARYAKDGPVILSSIRRNLADDCTDKEAIEDVLYRLGGIEYKDDDMTRTLQTDKKFLLCPADIWYYQVQHRKSEYYLPYKELFKFKKVTVNIPPDFKLVQRDSRSYASEHDLRKLAQKQLHKDPELSKYEFDLSQSSYWLTFITNENKRQYNYKDADEDKWKMVDESGTFHKYPKEFPYKFYKNATDMLSPILNSDEAEKWPEQITLEKLVMLQSRNRYNPDDAFVIELYKDQVLVAYRIVVHKYHLNTMLSDTKNDMFAYAVVAASSNCKPDDSCVDGMTCCSHAEKNDTLGTVALDENLRQRGIRIDWLGNTCQILDEVLCQLSTYYGVPILVPSSIGLTTTAYTLMDDNLLPMYFPSTIDYEFKKSTHDDPPAVVTNVVYKIIEVIIRGELCNLLFENGKTITMPRRPAFHHVGATLNANEVLMFDDGKQHSIDQNVSIEHMPSVSECTNYWIKSDGTVATDGRSWDASRNTSQPWTADMIVKQSERPLTRNCSFHIGQYTETQDSFKISVNEPFSLPENVQFIYLCLNPKAEDDDEKTYVILENRATPDMPMLGVIGQADVEKTLSVEDGVLTIDGVVRPCRWSHTPSDISAETEAVIKYVNNSNDGIVQLMTKDRRGVQISNPTRHYRAPTATIRAFYHALVRVTSADQ